MEYVVELYRDNGEESIVKLKGWKAGAVLAASFSFMAVGVYTLSRGAPGALGSVRNYFKK